MRIQHQRQPVCVVREFMYHPSAFKLVSQAASQENHHLKGLCHHRHGWHVNNKRSRLFVMAQPRRKPSTVPQVWATLLAAASRFLEDSSSGNTKHSCGERTQYSEGRSSVTAW